MLETPFYMRLVENKDKLGLRSKSLDIENWLRVHEVSMYSKVETPESGILP